MIESVEPEKFVNLAYSICARYGLRTSAEFHEWRDDLQLRIGYQNNRVKWGFRAWGRVEDFDLAIAVRIEKNMKHTVDISSYGLQWKETASNLAKDLEKELAPTFPDVHILLNLYDEPIHKHEETPPNFGFIS